MPTGEAIQAVEPARPAEFVLVHGSGQNARCWERVAGLLRARGHAVSAPDLPKHAPDWGYEDYAAAIARSAAGPAPVVVAHSFSGAFLPLVADSRPCALLVYLAALIPEPGKSPRDQLVDDPSMFSPAWLEAGSRWFDKSQEEALAREFLFHDCDDETLSWALGTVEVMDMRHLATRPFPLTAWAPVPGASIIATDDRTLSPGWGRRTSRRVLGIDAIEIKAGHCPHASQPGLVADLLERLARQHAA